MAPELKTLLASAEGQKRELLDRISAMPEATRRQAAPGKWSPLQTITHLVQFEESMLRWVNAAPAGMQPGVKAILVSSLIAATMRAAIPTPAPPGAEVGEPDTLPHLEARWQAVREALVAKADTVSAGSKHTFAQHPLLGPITAFQLLNMLDSHLTYHLRRPPLNVAAR